MLATPHSRWAAFAIHLALSAFVFIALAAVIIFVWYPGFLFQTDGGWQGIRLIAGIDLILGPLLTLIVYNKAKKSLPMDLSIIALVQVSALCVGSYLVYQERPLAIIFADNKFITMSHNSFAFSGLNPEEIPIVKQHKKPVWIYATSQPNMPGETNTQAFARLGPKHLRVDDYRRFSNYKNNLYKAGALQLDNQQSYKATDNIRYLKMISRYFEGYLAFDIANEKVIRTIITNSTDVYGVRSN